MTWPEQLADVAAAALDAGGEPVLLPSGDTVQGIFEPTGEPPAAAWPQAGLALRLDQEPNPRVWLADAMAADLIVEDRLTIRGVEYRVTAPPAADGSGLTPVELAPKRNGAALPQGARWK